MSNLRTRVIRLEGEPATFEVPYHDDTDLSARMAAILAGCDAYAVQAAPRVREILGRAMERRGDVG